MVGSKQDLLLAAEAELIQKTTGAFVTHNIL